MVPIRDRWKCETEFKKYKIRYSGRNISVIVKKKDTKYIYIYP